MSTAAPALPPPEMLFRRHSRTDRESNAVANPRHLIEQEKW